ncbi:hypothetical protein KBD18_00815 [Patescibacteria group bacterium]|nr:hypothetical protein [Patescibacteria group bacterium]
MEHGILPSKTLVETFEADREQGKRGHLLAGEWAAEYAVAVLVINDAFPPAEIHENAADVFTVLEGSAMVTLGGTLVNPRTVKPGEIQGDTLEGGETKEVHVGDVISIPKGVPHQLETRGGHATFLITKINHTV